jgi:hypothetical protein
LPFALNKLAVETQVFKYGEHRCKDIAVKRRCGFAAQRKRCTFKTVKGPEYEGYEHTKGLSASNGTVADNGISAIKGRIFTPRANNA